MDLLGTDAAGWQRARDVVVLDERLEIVRVLMGGEEAFVGSG